MSDNDDKTRIVRPLEQLQRAAGSGENDTKTTRKVDRDETFVDDPTGGRSIKPIRADEDDGKTRLFRPVASRPDEDSGFNPLAPRGAGSANSEDPVVGWLVVVKGPGRGSAVRLGYGWNSIGRDASQRASLDFGDSQITRLNHARLLYDPRARKFTVTLGEGTNPTYVRGEALLAPTELQDGDTVQIGETELRLVALCGPDFDWQD